MQGNFLKVFNTYLVGINWVNGFKTHNELTVYPLGNYPLAPSELYQTPLVEERTRLVPVPEDVQLPSPTSSEEAAIPIPPPHAMTPG